MSKVTGIQWFIEPIGKYTNDSIAQYLADAGIVNESISTAGHTYQGKHVDTFLVERDHVIKFLNNQLSDNQLHFNVYYTHFGNPELTKWKNSKILYDAEKSKKKIVPELDDKIRQSENEIAKILSQLAKEFGSFRINRLTAKVPKYLKDLDKISDTSKSLGRQTQKLRKLLTPKPNKK